MAILNKRLLPDVAIKVIINRRHHRRLWVNPIFTRKNVSEIFVNLIEEM